MFLFLSLFFGSPCQGLKPWYTLVVGFSDLKKKLKKLPMTPQNFILHSCRSTITWAMPKFTSIWNMGYWTKVYLNQVSKWPLLSFSQNIKKLILSHNSLDTSFSSRTSLTCLPKQKSKTVCTFVPWRCVASYQFLRIPSDIHPIVLVWTILGPI